MLIDHHGVHLNVVEEGSGSPIVFVHSTGGSTADWAAQFEAFSPDHRVIAIDLRGFGGSDVTREDVSLQDYADDIVAVLDELSIEKAAVVGLSLGGIVALQLAVSHPERLTGVMAADATSYVTEETAAQMVMSKNAAEQYGLAANVEMMRPFIFAQAAIDADAQYIHDYEARFAQTDPTGFGLAMQAVSRIDLDQRLSEVRIPVLAVLGEEDKIQPLPNSERIVSSVPGARLEIIPGASHMSNLDQPEAFNTLVREFLATL